MKSPQTELSARLSPESISSGISVATRNADEISQSESTAVDLCIDEHDSATGLDKTSNHVSKERGQASQPSASKTAEAEVTLETDTLRAAAADTRNAEASWASGRSWNKPKLALTAASLLLVLAGAAAWVVPQLTNNKANAARTKPLPVVTVAIDHIRIQPLDDTVTVTGAVSALDPLAIGAEVSGLRIKSVDVEEGDNVKRGQVLAVLNSAVLQAQLEQAEARYASSEATLKKTVQPNRPEDIMALKAAAAQADENILQQEALRRQAKANLINAVENEKRYVALANQGAVSRQDAETRITTRQTAEEQLRSSEATVRAARYTAEQAKDRLTLALKGGRLEDVQISQATRQEMKGNIDQLKALIEQTIIRAPEDGLITRRDAHIGDVSTSGKSLFYMVRANKLELRAQVADLDLPKFHVGQAVQVRATADDKRMVQGKVWLVSPQVDPVTRLGMVRIELPAHTWLKPGMFVQGDVNIGRRQMLTVPLSALVTHNGETFVFTLEGNDKVHAKSIKTGTKTDRVAEIVSGISPDETIVVEGAGFLSDGDPVRVSR